MKHWLAGVGLAAGVAGITGIALAQNVPSQFVVSGKDAEKIQDFTTINLNTAQRIVEACEKAADAQGVKISAYVLDNDGDYVYMDRMDGQGYLNIITAEMKARTALMGRQPSKIRMNRVIEDPNAELPQIQLGFFPNSGGLPIAINHQLIGAVGVGGSAPKPPVWSDEICAHKALTEVIGAANTPPLVQDMPVQRNRNQGKAPVPKFVVDTAPKSALPAEFVVSGKGAATVLDANQISLAAAKKIARTCRDYAAEHNSGVSVFILDNAGEFVHMERMDGQTYNNTRTALLKAQTALRTRQPTSIRAAQLKNDPSGLARSVYQYNFFGVAGGIPIVVDGQMIGAIGVGGGNADEACAIEGLKATFGNRVTVPVYPTAAN
jgi:glc operon protein GlcG